MDSNFQAEVSRSLGQLEAGIKGINDRLDKLNGSVARHEKRLGDLETREAVQEAKAEGAKAVQDAKEQTAKETSKSWREVVIPIAKALLVLLLGAALGSKGPEIVKALGQ